MWFWQSDNISISRVIDIDYVPLSAEDIYPNTTAPALRQAHSHLGPEFSCGAVLRHPPIIAPDWSQDSAKTLTSLSARVWNAAALLQYRYPASCRLLPHTDDVELFPPNAAFDGVERKQP